MVSESDDVDRRYSVMSQVVFWILFLSTLPMAAPCASFFKTDFEHPPVNEGETGQLVFRIPIMNDGDEDLVIRNVRLGCGCTRVEYDTIVCPRTTGTVKATVDITGKAGPMETHLSVQTNEPGDPMTRITLRSYVHPIIAVGTRRVEGSDALILVLQTTKPDLQLHNIRFSPQSA
ncbi:MAG: DUF1573 domain-containing protein, partial [Chitinivibrionales bacterium]|nr:DUF1573 domain-containing protein [Chitinivibrionales bacterium]